MQQSKIKDLRAKILSVLKEKPEARNDDVLLTLLLWIKAHPGEIFKNAEGQPCARLQDIRHFVREDNVKRLRAKIQNEEHLFLPTTEEVRRQRRISEAEWREYCKHN